MIDEEKEAIKKLNLLIKVFRNSVKEEEPDNWDNAESIEIALNLIQKQQKEIKHWKNGFERELEHNRTNTIELLKQDRELEKKDKIIDEMAKWIFGKDYAKNSLNIDRDDYWSNCIKKVKQYFEKKVGR